MEPNLLDPKHFTLIFLDSIPYMFLCVGACLCVRVYNQPIFQQHCTMVGDVLWCWGCVHTHVLYTRLYSCLVSSPGRLPLYIGCTLAQPRDVARATARKQLELQWDHGKNSGQHTAKFGTTDSSVYRSCSGPTWDHFGFCRRCRVAGSVLLRIVRRWGVDRVPLVPLGWYWIFSHCQTHYILLIVRHLNSILFFAELYLAEKY